MLLFNKIRNNLFRYIRNEPLASFLPDNVRGISHTSALAFNITPCLMAMPMKRKRRIDPAVIKAREERKKRRIEREIRQLERLKKTLRPIEEARVPLALVENMEARRRIIEVPESVREERILYFKKWNTFRNKQNTKEMKEISNIVLSQQMALDELQKESLELYNAAIQIDPGLIPFSFSGPTETPPMEDYNSPDGEYVDISRNWFIPF